MAGKQAKSGAERQAAYRRRQEKQEPWRPTNEPRTRQRLWDRGARDFRAVRNAYKAWLNARPAPTSDAETSLMSDVEECIALIDVLLDGAADIRLPRVRM